METLRTGQYSLEEANNSDFYREKPQNASEKVPKTVPRMQDAWERPLSKLAMAHVRNLLTAVGPANALKVIADAINDLGEGEGMAARAERWYHARNLVEQAIDEIQGAAVKYW